MHRWPGAAMIIGALTVAVPTTGVAKSKQEQPRREPPPTYRIPVATSPIVVDAVLDEQAWRDALVVEITYEIQPGENTPAPVRTICYLTHDRHNVYAAFRAFDPDPGAIRAHVTDRDRAFRDDFVGVFLDTFNDQRRGYEFFVNPLGVQMDLSRNEVGSNNNEDSSWDAIWSSAGRITAEGYEVEMAIPFSSLRFARTDGEQTWGIQPARAYPRTLRHILFSTPQSRDDNCMMCTFPKVTGFAGIAPGRDLEFDPTLTVQRTDALADQDDLSTPFVRGSVKTEAGLSTRWGVTPNLSLNAALNPDFSQVEADAPQLDVNTRFALLYPEKRPFFMEGADYFSTPFNALYTRTIGNPSWGVKLTGKPGKQALGVFAAHDKETLLLFPANQSSNDATLAQGADVGVVRYRRDVGESSTLGFLATGRSGTDYSNGLIGIDGVVRLSKTDYLDFQLLRSRTRYPGQVAQDFDQPAGDFDGTAAHLFYSHDTRNWSAYAWYEDLGKGFRADLGFIPRVDTRSGEVGALYTFLGAKGDWYSILRLGAETGRTEDHQGLLTDQWTRVSARYEGPLQSYLQLTLSKAREYYEGRTYDENYANLMFNIRVNGTFTCSLSGKAGDAIDYDNSRPGKVLRLGPGFTWDIGRHLALTFDHAYERLNVDAGRLYSANVSQLRVVYQFNVRTFVRTLLQYRDVTRNPDLYTDAVAAAKKRLFAQLLFSYKLDPQTVVFLGFADTRGEETGFVRRPTNRTAFLKVGYAWLM